MPHFRIIIIPFLQVRNKFRKVTLLKANIQQVKNLNLVLSGAKAHALNHYPELLVN